MILMIRRKGIHLQQELLHQKHDNLSKRCEESLKGFTLFLSRIRCDTEHEGDEKQA